MAITPKNWASFQHYKDRAPAWIKLHKGLLDDFGFHRLPLASRALAPLLWLLASEYEDGHITASLDELAFRLHMSADELSSAIQPLIEAGFFVSDSGVLAERKQDAIPEKEREIQVEKEEEKELSRSKPTERAPSRFDEFWQAYPRRDGPNPRKDAEIKFNRMVKNGINPQTMIDAAKQLAIDEQRRGNVGTRFIPQAVTWLNGQRWIDHAAEVLDKKFADDGLIEVLDDEALTAWDNYRRAKEGRTFPRNARGGWRFPSKYPPGYEPRKGEASPPVIPQLPRMGARP